MTTTKEKELDLSKFIVYLYEKDETMEIFYKDKLVHTTQLYKEEDQWYGFKVNGQEVDLNIYEGMAGLYDTIKIGKNTYKTDEFLGRIEIKKL